MFLERIHPHRGGPKFWKKNTWKFFFEKPSHGCLSPPFDGERGGIWGANGEGGGLYTTLLTKYAYPYLLTKYSYPHINTNHFKPF